MDLQDPILLQRGRASLAFLTQMGLASQPLRQMVDTDMERAGMDADSLPEDMDQRYQLIDERLRNSAAYTLQKLLGEWYSRRYGDIAIEAFEEILPHLAPAMASADQGPARLTLDPEFNAPNYWAGVHFHRTSGGWEGHQHMGYIHGEIIHKKMVARFFPGGIFKQRIAVAEMAPKAHYDRILDMGCSSGHFTVALARTFPDAKINGVDLSGRMIEHAYRVANTNGWDWDLYQRPAEATGFADASFDLVTSYILLHELPADAIRAVIAEAYRVLVPGGDMLMSDVTRYADLDRLSAWKVDRDARFGGEPHWRESASLDLATLAQKAGFTDVTASGHYPHVLIARKPT